MRESKTDEVDAGTLAKSHAAGFLPEVWVADEDTYSRRRQMAEPAGVLVQIIRIKGRMKAILHASHTPMSSISITPRKAAFAGAIPQ
ncbi:hypothetical protein ACVIHH_008305 [Bradyrhizobium sp. USDA 4518]